VEVYIGMIFMFAGNFAPLNFAFCNGQLLAIAQYQALFSILGTTYGGDGRVNFALPNMQCRVPIHAGQAPGLSSYALGEAGGREQATLLLANMPTHNHVIMADSGLGNKTTPAGNVPAAGSATGEKLYSTAAPTSAMNPAMVTPAGNGTPFPVLQPFLTVNFIIAINGLFPPRN
jgi:microcystin-dependent protein